MQPFFRVALLLGSLAVSGSPAMACSLGGWSHTAGAAGLSAGSPVDGHRRFQGECGLRLQLSEGPRFVEDDSPNSEGDYLVRFYLFADELELEDDGWVEVFNAFDDESGERSEFAIRVVRHRGALALSVRTRDNGGTAESEPLTLQPGWRGVEVQWHHATGPANGEMRVLVDGVERDALSGLGNRESGIDMVRLGATALSGARGRLDFDAFESRRDTGIGVLKAGDATGDERLNAADLVVLVSEINGKSLAGGQPDCNADGNVDETDLDCLANEILRQ